VLCIHLETKGLEERIEKKKEDAKAYSISYPLAPPCFTSLFLALNIISSWASSPSSSYSASFSSTSTTFLGLDYLHLYTRLDSRIFFDVRRGCVGAATSLGLLQLRD
jgi:hypothetical protein